MPFSEFEKTKYERMLSAFIDARRPPPDIRPKLDLGYRLSNQSIEIFEVRPRWDEPQKSFESGVAKATFVRTERIWRVFWQRADLRWHSYPPAPRVRRLEEFLALVDQDEHACFFG